MFNKWKVEIMNNGALHAYGNVVVKKSFNHKDETLNLCP